MLEQITIQKFLNREFTKSRIKNPSYSMRACAKRLNLRSATLSLVLNGKRKISEELAKQVTDHLTLSPKERRSVLSINDLTPLLYNRCDNIEDKEMAKANPSLAEEHDVENEMLNFLRTVLQFQNKNSV